MKVLVISDLNACAPELFCLNTTQITNHNQYNQIEHIVTNFLKSTTKLFDITISDDKRNQLTSQMIGRILLNDYATCIIGFHKILFSLKELSTIVEYR